MGCAETSLRNYHSTLRKVQKDGSYHLYTAAKAWDHAWQFFVWFCVSLRGPDRQYDSRLKLVTVFSCALPAHVTCRQWCHTPVLGLTVYQMYTQIHMVDLDRDTVTSHTPRCSRTLLIESSWNVMAHGDSREGKWRGNWRMERVASTRHTTSEHDVSSITTADAHTSAASRWLNWRPLADLNGLVRFAERRNLVSAPSHFNWPLPAAHCNADNRSGYRRRQMVISVCYVCSNRSRLDLYFNFVHVQKYLWWPYRVFPLTVKLTVVALSSPRSH